MILSTKLAGIGHGAFLFMASARDVVSYVYPNVNAAGAGLFLSETFTPATTNLADGGYHMYVCLFVHQWEKNYSFLKKKQGKQSIWCI